MTSFSSKLHLLAVYVVVVILIFFQLSFDVIADPPESDLCNFDDETDLDYSLPSKRVNAVEGCLFAGECTKREDCSPLCAAMGMSNNDPSAVKCIPNPAGDGMHCCCPIPKSK